METEFLSELGAILDESRFPTELIYSCELMECLSCSEGCETLLAKDKRNGALYVVKCYESAHPLFSESEPEALRRLSHPGLPLFIAEYKTDTMRCVLRQYIEGEPLSALIPPLNEDAVRCIGQQLCEILTYLHGQNPPVIHRDIKPQNVILSENGKISLIDFGISRLFTKEAKSDTVAFGTRAFAPPEQYGFSQTDCRSDIFSLGMLLHYLLTGNTDLQQSPCSPLEKIFARCTAFDPKDRYENAQAVLRRLEVLSPNIRKQLRRIKILFASIVLSLIVGTGSWWYHYLIRDNSQPAYSPSQNLQLPANADQTADSKETWTMVFAEPLIEQGVRTMLDKGKKETISQEELASVTALYIVGDKVLNNSDDFYAAVSAWDKADIRTYGSIRTLADVSLLPNLKTLCLVAQKLSDISPLSEVPALEKVEFKHNSIYDVTSLASLEYLTSVGLNGNPVKDLTPLESCSKLRLLDLCDAQAYDPAFLDEMGDFDFLDVSNATNSYLHLSGKRIRQLKLCWTTMTTLDCLEKVTGIEALELNNTAVTDLSPLLQHSSLKRLRLSALDADDLSVLLNLPHLEQVTFSRDMKPAVEALGPVSFEIRYE